MKLRILKFLVLLFITLWIFNTTNWAYTESELRLYYDKFYSKVEQKYSDKDKVLNILNNFWKKIDSYLSKTKNKNNIKILSTFSSLNSAKINYLNKPNLGNASIIEINNEQKKVIDQNKYYSYDELKDFFENYLDLEKPILYQNWDYFWFKYSKFFYFEWDDKLSYRDLVNNKVDLNKSLLVKDWNKYYFVNDFKKLRITSEKTIWVISNKDEFLKYLFDDNRYFEWNYDESLLKIKSITQELIKWKTTDEDKISSIYKRIIDNTSYYTEYNDWNNYIFSWIYTFENKTWVCDWYTKIFLYMLSFAWIKDVEVLRWYAYDSADFPSFWHAWVRIWDYYYDPTFDDPVSVWDYKKDYFSYYKLPRELIYINRFDWIKIIDNLDKLSLKERQNIVMKNMYNIYEKYKDYELMKTIKNRIYLWIAYNEDISLEKLKNLMWFYEVSDFTIYDDKWYSRKISSLKYYNADNETLKLLLNDRNTDFSKMYLLKWTDSNGISYKLAYDLVFR